MTNQSRYIAPSKAIVIYHANCKDGMTAAWVFKNLVESSYSGGVQYIAANYGDDPPSKSDAHQIDLYILDFSFKRPVIAELAENYASVTVLDHHKTAQEDLADWDNKPSNLEIVFDMERSGAGIAWDYFAETADRPALVDYVEDYDLGRTFKGTSTLSYSVEINAVIAQADKDFASYDSLYNLIKNNFNLAVSMGELLQKQFTKLCVEIVEATARPVEINGHKGLVCNCNHQFASAVGNILAQKSGTFGATYYSDNKDNARFSLRSVGDYDVSKIAAEFGGGGHKNAAGFTITNPLELPTGATVWGLQS